MTIQFQIHYLTHWGQQLAVVIESPELAIGKSVKEAVMEYSGDGRWQLSVPFLKAPASITYRYVLLQDGKSPVEEAGGLRMVRLPRNADRLLLRDTWRNPEATEEAFFTAAFESAIFHPKKTYKAEVRKAHDGCVPVHFHLRAAAIPQDWQLAITGNLPELGNWDTSRPVLMGNSGYPLWTAEVCLPWNIDIEYKYGLYHPGEKRWIDFESGDNRHWRYSGTNGKPDKVLLNDEYAHFPGPPWKGAGVALPVFSLRSERSLGVGEFEDLKLLADWASESGLRMIQILPINDTTITNTWTDSYPYSAISVFALHPLYLAFDTIPGAEKIIGKKNLQAARKSLNAKSAVDYDEVVRIKKAFSLKVYEGVKNDLLNHPDFLDFVSSHKDWLMPYAVFCYLRDTFGTVDFTQWGQYAQYDKAAVEALAAPGAPTYDAIAFFYFQQYYLDIQLSEASAYARAKGIVLKGDLPIGIYRHSADAWVAPSLYNMDGQAGAPPDPFSATGQNWGFPTYNWAEMAKDQYAWWRKRMTHLSRYFDAYRIDHILGFFRIWEIPIRHLDGLMGRFRPAIPVTRQELDALGIGFEPSRFCQPYLTEELLTAKFGPDATWVKSTFLEKSANHCYTFKANWDGQRKVDEYLKQPEQAAYLPHRDALLQLFGEVLFFEEPGSDHQAFHPRIDFAATYSFQQLPQDARNKLLGLHHQYFYQRQEEFWKGEALNKLPAIKKATNMLICGEDLGMVPACVPGVMRATGMLSLEIQRMSKNPSTEFLQTTDIPYLSVTSPSTHDMAPLRAWWEEMDEEQMRRFYHQELGFTGEPPRVCEPFIAEAVIRQHLHWHNMWTVFPLQDLLAMDGALRRSDPFEERINVPAIARYYWQYRVHLSLESLLQEKEFSERLRSMLVASGRCAPGTKVKK